MLSGFATWLLHRRSLVRLPVVLFRLRLGSLFGSRLVMIEHRGRVTGKRRYTALEVIERTGDEYLVASGFGRASEWFRNIEVDPEVRLWSGSHMPIPAVARVLGESEAAAAISRYARQRPRSWRVLEGVFRETLGASIRELPVIALHVGAQ